MPELLKSKQPADEIDLLELLARITLSIKNNFRSLVIAFLIGSAIGTIFYYSVPKTYESKMLVVSDILTESNSKILVKELDELIRDGNNALIASKLTLTESQAASIGTIEISDSEELINDEGEVEKTYLVFLCGSNDNSIWPDLQKGIVTYFDNNLYLKTIVGQQKDYIKKTLEKLNNELNSLFELKTKVMSGQLTQTSKENLWVFDPTRINLTIVDLSREKFELENSLQNLSSVQLIEGFTTFNKPASPKLSLSILAGSSLGVIFVFLLIGYRSIKKLIQLSEKKIAEN